MRLARIARALKRRDNQRGQALVEFVLVLPLFLLFMFGIIEFARAFNYWNQETHVANLGARQAAVNKNPGAADGLTLQQWIKKRITSPQLRDGLTQGAIMTPGTTVQICFPKGTANVGDPVKVIAKTEYNWLSILGLDMTKTTLVGSATMRIEVSPASASPPVYTADAVPAAECT